MRSRNNKESLICDLVYECLEDFSLATGLSTINAHEHSGGISVNYFLGGLPTNRDRTYFELQIVGEECYILGFGVERSKRKQGYGSELFRRVELFCSRYGLRKLITTPSGQGILFWAKMGFEKINEHETAKAIT